MRPALGRRHLLASLCAASALTAAGVRALGGPKAASAAPPPEPPDVGWPGDPSDPDWSSRAGSDWPSMTSGADPDAIRIDLPQLKYSGSWSPRSGAMRVLARELRLRTRLEPVTEPSTVAADSASLFETPFLYVAGDGGLPALGETSDAQLRRFVDLGGLILFDAADGGSDPGFTNDVKTLLSRIAPASELTPVSREHVIYRSFYLVDFPFGRTQSHEHLLAIQEEGRIKVLLMRNDLGGALAETDDGLAAYPCTPGGAEQREWAIRLGVNVLLYATCTDYKADRAHVETLLRSRRWR